jgi:hypothetical protein
MSKFAEPGNDLVYSQPVMCLHCHLLVEMFHKRGADPDKGPGNARDADISTSLATGKSENKP